MYVTTSDAINSFLDMPSSGGTELAPAGQRFFSSWLFSRIKSSFVSAFIFLYTLGFPKLMGIITGIIVLLILVEQIIRKLARILSFRRSGS